MARNPWTDPDPQPGDFDEFLASIDPRDPRYVQVIEAGNGAQGDAPARRHGRGRRESVRRPSLSGCRSRQRQGKSQGRQCCPPISMSPYHVAQKAQRRTVLVDLADPLWRRWRLRLGLCLPRRGCETGGAGLIAGGES